MQKEVIEHLTHEVANLNDKIIKNINKDSDSIIKIEIDF